MMILGTTHFVFFWWLYELSEYHQVNYQSLRMWTSLVGGLEHFLFFHIGNIHPNWLSYFSEGLKPPTSRVCECEHRRCKKKGMFTGGYFRYGIHCWVSQQPQINWAPTISLCLAGRPIYHGFMALFWDVLSGKFLCASFFAKLEIPEDLFFPPHFPSCSIIFPHFPQIFPRFPHILRQRRVARDSDAVTVGPSDLSCFNDEETIPPDVSFWGERVLNQLITVLWYQGYNWVKNWYINSLTTAIMFVNVS